MEEIKNIIIIKNNNFGIDNSNTVTLHDNILDMQPNLYTEINLDDEIIYKNFNPPPIVRQFAFCLN
tara:strand:- start:431 stop:628 length:198 start_codon:yes stop_codon:yes gene_type:complete